MQSEAFFGCFIMTKQRVPRCIEINKHVCFRLQTDITFMETSVWRKPLALPRSISVFNGHTESYRLRGIKPLSKPCNFAPKRGEDVIYKNSQLRLWLAFPLKILIFSPVIYCCSSIGLRFITKKSSLRHSHGWLQILFNFNSFIACAFHH